MSHLERLVRENVRLLEQGRTLVAGLAEGVYAEPAPALGLSGVGSHFRHCIDFYACFVAGLAEGRLDYDARERDPRVERDPVHARRRAGELADSLRRLASDATGGSLRVKAEACDAAEDERWAASSVERELQFLCSHTVHHYALMAAVLRSHGHEPGREFGVAPSTLEYWKEEAGACAP